MCLENGFLEAPAFRVLPFSAGHRHQSKSAKERNGSRQRDAEKRTSMVCKHVDEEESGLSCSAVAVREVLSEEVAALRGGKGTREESLPGRGNRQ